MKENKTKPDIRFKGFTEAWEQRKLKDLIVDLKSGLSRMLKNEDIGVPVVRANNIEDNKLDMNNDVKYWYNPDPQGAKIENYTIKKDDILINFINSEAKMGTATIVKKTPIRPIIYTTNILRMRTNTLLKPYFYLTHTNLQQYKNYIKQIMKPAVNQASFTTVDYKNYNLKIPKEDEQHKIELIFKNIDNLITLHQRECDQLKELKKSMLKKMFPRDESSIPEVRFAGFTDAWEQRKLGTLCSLITKGTTPKDKSGNGEVNFVKVENIDIDNGEITSTSKISIAEHEGYLKRSKLKENDILFSIAGTLGRVSVVKSSILPANINQALAILRINEGYIPYLTTVLKGRAVEDFIRRNPTIGAQPNLSLEQVNNLDISYPNYDEQVRIGQYFSNLDNLITLHQRLYVLVKK